jgi:hypothetical protein
MSLKKRDDDASRRYWEFVERTAREVREQRPTWARELDRRDLSDETDDRRNSDCDQEKRTR